MKVETDPFVTAPDPPAGMGRPGLFGQGFPWPFGTRESAVLVVAAVVVGLLLLYFDTARSMASVWYRSETFAHGFLVAPIALWLVWRDRHRLAGQVPRPFYPALIGVALAGFGWLLGELASVIGVTHFALVLMLQASLIAVLGLEIARRIAFPLAFLLFAVPAGEFLVPAMMNVTADVTIAALRATGVPVYREGNFFLIPTGAWSVVEACSGVRYLIASFMVGCLYAYLVYRKPMKRLAFVAVSLAVPVVANWLRAYLIVMIGHLSGNKLAAGVDHLIYGWLFFGVVITLTFWIGYFWRDSPQPAPAAAVGAAAGGAPTATGSLLIAAAFVLSLASLWPAALAALDAPRNTLPPALAASDLAGPWQPAAPFTAWKPAFESPRAELNAAFQRDGAAAGLYLAYYRDQRQGAELVSSLNALVKTSDPSWRLVGSGTAHLAWKGRALRAKSALLAGSGQRLLVYQWYWVDGRLTAADPLAKLYLAWLKLQGRGDDSALVVVYTPFVDAGEAAEHILQRFVADMAPAIDDLLERAAGGGRP